MELRDRKVLLVSPDPWDHIFVSKHHYAIHLAARGNLVWFLNPPRGRREVRATAYERLFVINYDGFPRGLRFMPRGLQRWVMRRALRILENMTGASFDVIWSFDNSVFFDFSALRPSLLKISHIVDSSQNFQLARAAETADVCLCVSDAIRESLLKHTPRVFKIGHGYAPGALRGVSIPGANRVKAVYAGNLTIPYLDWETLKEAVSANADVDFIFIGPGAQDPAISDHVPALEKLGHVFFLGGVDHGLLQSYYKEADILMVCYQEKFQAAQVTNAHKIMEYLAAGKVIVSTYTSECREWTQLLSMTRRNAEYAQLFKQTVNRLPELNSLEKQRQRRSVALDNTYERQIERIESILKSECASSLLVVR